MYNKASINNSGKKNSVKEELNTVLISMSSVLTIDGANNLGVIPGNS